MKILAFLIILGLIIAVIVVWRKTRRKPVKKSDTGLYATSVRTVENTKPRTWDGNYRYDEYTVRQRPSRVVTPSNKMTKRDSSDSDSPIVGYYENYDSWGNYDSSPASNTDTSCPPSYSSDNSSSYGSSDSGSSSSSDSGSSSSSCD